MMDSELTDRMDGLETRLFRLEELLGVNRRSVIARQKHDIDREPTAAVPESPVMPELFDQDSPAEVSVTPPPLPVMSYQSSAPVQPIPQAGLEQTIGLKWAGWVGAVVLVIGAGLGIKFAYDQGWFAVVSPAVRLTLLAMSALSLIAAGEWVFRRVNVLSAAGLFGAGVAMLFVVSYSGYACYDLYPRNTAFILMGISTVIGALVARRGNMVSIAVLSLIGGNLAPVLLAKGQPELAGFLSYLLTLQGVALILAAWGASPKWWTLRALSLATMAFWVLNLIDQSGQGILIPFTIAFAGLYQLELLVSAARSRLDPSRAGTTFSMFVTAGLTSVMLYWLTDSTQMNRIAFVLGMSAVTGLASLACDWASKKSARNAAFAELATGYAIQSLALIVVAVPIAFSGVWISCAWAVLAVALAVLGCVLDKPMAKYSAPAVWILAVGHLSLWAIGFDGLHHDRLIALSIAGVDFYQQTLMYWLLALLGQVIATLVVTAGRTPAPSLAKQIGAAISVMSSCVWVLAAVTALPPLIATSCVLAYSTFLIVLDRLDDDLNFLSQTAVITGLAAGKWAFMDLLARRLFSLAMVESIVLSARGLAGAILQVNLFMLHHRSRATLETNASSRQIKSMVGVLIVGAVFWMGTMGIDQEFINLKTSTTAIFSDPDRAEQVALSIFWSMFAIASITAGFGWRTVGLRYFGLALFALTLLKVVTIDLSQVSTGYRIMSFMGLGILLLGTSVIYGKVSPILLARTNVETDTL